MVTEVNTELPTEPLLQASAMSDVILQRVENGADSELGLQQRACSSEDFRGIQPISFDIRSINAEWVRSLQSLLLKASQHPPTALKSFVPASVVCDVLRAVLTVIRKEKTLLTLDLDNQATVVVVGDTHGHLQDVCRIFELGAEPSTSNIYVFNGDYVDRGSWGVENLLLLAAWKLAVPSAVYMLRGDHESQGTTLTYGFRAELIAKYGHEDAKVIYGTTLSFFSHLPIAALIANKTLVVHGGLFRKPGPEGKSMQLGTLADLKATTKGGLDPDGTKPQDSVAADVLWSDPGAHTGLRRNVLRGDGITFGPDATKKFLEDNDLKLVIRSHESPDARDFRREANKINQDLPPMRHGYTWDHITTAGSLVTLFSAPNYPMLPDSVPPNSNAAAIAILKPPYTEPNFVSFEAADRPKVYLYIPGYDNNDKKGAKKLGNSFQGVSGGVGVGFAIPGVNAPHKKTNGAANNGAMKSREICGAPCVIM